MQLFKAIITGNTRMVTLAVESLRKAGTSHRLMTYDHDPAAESFGAEAADALDLGATFHPLGRSGGHS